MIAGPPVTCARSPSGRSAAATWRISVTLGDTAASLVVSTGTATIATVPSGEYVGGAACPPTPSGASAAARAATASLSCWVSAAPSSRL